MGLFLFFAASNMGQEPRKFVCKILIYFLPAPIDYFEAGRAKSNTAIFFNLARVWSKMMRAIFTTTTVVDVNATSTTVFFFIFPQ